MEWDIDRFRADLLAFYDRAKRDLPWRRERDPYRVLVSEFMLQQTRVETVLPYYRRWLERFPDLGSLADAAEHDVLKMWEGLGYYRRARNLHAAARLVRDRWDGALPADRESLRSLPGVGAYTAGAVASIAFGEPVPAVDGNVRRVLSRLFDIEEPGPRWLEETAQELVDTDRPGDWNQALMELGATICTPVGAECGRCPVRWMCRAVTAGTVAVRPVSGARRALRKVVYALAVLRRPDGAVLLGRRPEGGLLGGMWALPEREVSSPEESKTREAAMALSRELGSAVGPALGEASGDPRVLAPVRHRFTHIDATYVPWLFDVATVDSARASAERSEWTWASAEERGVLAIPVAQRAVLAALDESGSTPRGPDGAVVP